MSGRITGKNGEFWAPAGDGISLDNQALSVNATKKIQGIDYASRFYGTSARTAWNRAKATPVMLQGFAGEVTITPGTAVDTVVVSTNTFHKDASGVQSVTATQTLTLTRATVASTVQIHMISQVMSTGVAEITVGTIATGTISVDTFGTVGGNALIPVANLLIGRVILVSGAAAVVTASELANAYSTSAGVLLQERSDVPGFTILPLEGGVLLNEALLICHAGTLARKLYADFYDQYPLVTKMGDLENININGSSDTVVMQAMGDYAPQSDFSGPPKSSGTASRFYVSDTRLFALAMQRRAGIIRIVPDNEAPTVFFEAAIKVKSWGIGIGVGSAIKENFAFDIDGNLELRGL